MTASSFTDRRDADDAVFDAEVARLDGLEVADESAVERVARAIWVASGRTDDWATDKHAQAFYRRLASAAIDALKPAPGTDTSDQAVQRVLALAAHMGRLGTLHVYTGADTERLLLAAVAGPQRDHDEEGA